MTTTQNPVYFSDDADALEASRIHTSEPMATECDGRIADDPDADTVYLGGLDSTIDGSGVRRSWAVDAVGQIWEVSKLPSGLWTIHAS